ncbi:uncharacterized protein PGRI_046830 [Penicillium griseofulvum]|uniref:Trichothecene 3-O-acetyltransferase-like N-terminal domain-containing protein n=1 Tax=Penicillium patulum TaxID=5078 RepID=A0A135LA11_PENPA|nr:uncharacterized protein PGRI_046830 [Penicillium griseofulvum]KXG45827.1 hypothetical protein PGRI_046830 [Penicillium griseofulvum]
MRILVLALTIAGLRSLRLLYGSKHPDETWNAFMPAIWLQLIISSSVLCTCIPTLKRVLAELHTGMMAGVVSDFFEQSVSGHTNTGDRSASKSDNAIEQRSGSGSAPRSRIRSDSIDPERVDVQKDLHENAMRTIDYEAFYEGPDSSRADGNTDVFKIPSRKSSVVNDLQHDPSALIKDGLRQAKHHFTMLDENTITPCTTLSLPVYMGELSIQISSLKAVAMNTLPPAPSDFISMDAAVSAFIWQPIARAGILVWGIWIDAYTPVDMRQRLFPRAVLLAVSEIQHRHTIQKLFEDPLGFAAKLRSQLNQANNDVSNNKLCP